MADIFTNARQRFQTGSILTKFIFINVGIFVLIRIIMVIMKLFLRDAGAHFYLEMPSSPILLLHRPWTLITYMFVHFDFLHILFNMLWLYTFGRIFLMFFTGRQLGGLYILGGIAGGVFFLLAYNIFPYFRTVSDSSYLVGASASVMAIVFAVSFYQKNYELNLLFLGRLKLIYLAIGALLIDIFAMASENAGGHIAHIGGALFGILFATSYQKGKDITGFINRLIDRFVNLFKKEREPKFKVYENKNYKADTAYRRPETDDEYLRRKHAEEQEIDKILDKLKRSGYESLSSEEKKTLFNASKK
ncbi:MAG: rhomboid family intramembrane serine protease [Tannerella sp.]|jgi:membrane associated rhomboid family serine protease|nr:rhomboid family intramembrane serine protease [Tannerella sp.]